MNVTLTDEQFEKLEDLLIEAGWACQGTAYWKTQEALAIVRSLTREPAPAAGDAGIGTSGKGTVPHAPRCAVHTEPGDTALTEEECCTCGAMEPAPCPHRDSTYLAAAAALRLAANQVVRAVNEVTRVAESLHEGADAFLAEENASAAQSCAAPAGCQHRERLREAFDALPRECCKTDSDLLDRIEAALKQPCAAPACSHGDLQECYSVEFGGYLRIMDDAGGSCAALAEVPPGARVFVAPPAQPCAAPGEAGEWETVPHCGQGRGLGPPRIVVDAYPHEFEWRVQRRRAPEREGGAK